ncbi:hypothetical protein DCS_07508 [Drechmeria coniospora]|uniref:Uncharacterized protein n=1 Tax=Drechmeria coniospora TaxID=98403 RepID=A0A151GEM6_DRECN|nr:hypothetical protein DCS_07508 [Drechmeria coniospora]KYK55545.1 hypothetical protein DCS_07508 [Drechmeria coniospora]ODA81846.1 hypothetical protein RJ55_00351 [Drechmeria coniospora]
MGSAESRNIEARLGKAIFTNVNLPRKFYIWHTGRTSTKFFLAEDKSNPTHLVSVPNACRVQLILYNGPTIEAEPMAVILFGNDISRHDRIQLAARPGEEMMHEEIRSHCHRWSTAYTFATFIKPGALPERFQWRSSRCNEVKDLNEASSGYKLVRLGGDEEIVAVASHARWGKNWTKAGAFKFVGRGVTGEFGEPWQVIAVASLIRILQKDIESASTAALISCSG